MEGKIKAIEEKLEKLREEKKSYNTEKEKQEKKTP